MEDLTVYDVDLENLLQMWPNPVNQMDVSCVFWSMDLVWTHLLESIWLFGKNRAKLVLDTTFSTKRILTPACAAQTKTYLFIACAPSLTTSVDAVPLILTRWSKWSPSATVASSVWPR